MGPPCGVGRIAQRFRGPEVVAKTIDSRRGARAGAPLPSRVATVFVGRSRVGHVHVAYNTSHSGTWHFPSGISPPSDVPSVRVALAARLRRAEGVRNPLALGARNLSTGLKSKISGLFLRTNLDGVGRRRTGIGPRLGTVSPMPMCAFWAHVVIPWSQ
jgi:hypothetical protein